MANNTKISTPAPPSNYIDFNPSCEFKKEDGLETMIIQLQGFKKEQLRVQVNNNRELKVSGERPTSVNGTQRSRLLKETKIPEGCDINYARAKFINGLLRVTMPKKVAKLPAFKANQQKPATASSKPQSKATGFERPPKADDMDSKAKDTSNENGNKGTSTSYDQPKGDHKFKNEVSSHKGCTLKKEVVLGFEIV